MPKQITDQLQWEKVLPFLSVPGEDTPLDLDDGGFTDARKNRFFPIHEGVPQFMEAPLDEDVMQHFNETAKKFGKAPKSVEVVAPIATMLRKELYRITDSNDAVKTLVDVGCGHGQFSAPLASKHTVFGVDVSQEMLKLTGGTGIYPLLADGIQLPLRSQSIDCAYSIEVVQLFEDPGPILAEMSRILKPGGSLVISTLYRYSLLRRINRLMKWQGHNEGTRLRRPYDLLAMVEGLPLELASVSWLIGPTTFALGTSGPTWFFSPLATNVLVHLRRKT